MELKANIIWKAEPGSWIGDARYEYDLSKDYGVYILIDMYGVDHGFRCAVSEKSIYDWYVGFQEEKTESSAEFFDLLNQKTLFNAEGSDGEFLKFINEFEHSSLSDEVKGVTLLALFKSAADYYDSDK